MNCNKNAEVSFEVEELECPVVDFVVGRVSADMAGTIGVDAELPDHVGDHLLHPLASESFELVQEGAFVVLGAAVLAELAGNEVEHDALVHLGAIVVVVYQDAADFRAADGLGGGGEEDKGQGGAIREGVCFCPSGR